MTERLFGKVTFDLVMDDEMSFIEGCYQLPGKSWEIFIFTKNKDLFIMNIDKDVIWDSGNTGVVVNLPQYVKLNKSSALKILSDILHVAAWSEVIGPDSMQLR